VGKLETVQVAVAKISISRAHRVAAMNSNISALKIRRRKPKS